MYIRHDDEFAYSHYITVFPGLTDEDISRQLAADDQFALVTLPYQLTVPLPP